jgi:hypothetical protein
MEETRPIKRSKELAPLSREHHDGLLFAWKIKQGLANDTPIETIVSYTRWFWSNHIRPHFRDEEKVLVKFLPPDNPLVKQMFKEQTLILFNCSPNSSRIISGSRKENCLFMPNNH